MKKSRVMPLGHSNEFSERHNIFSPSAERLRIAVAFAAGNLASVDKISILTGAYIFIYFIRISEYCQVINIAGKFCYSID